MTVADHLFVTVLNRRWCLRCDVFQSRTRETQSWRPAAPVICPVLYNPTTAEAAGKRLDELVRR